MGPWKQPSKARKPRAGLGGSPSPGRGATEIMTTTCGRKLSRASHLLPDAGNPITDVLVLLWQLCPHPPQHSGAEVPGPQPVFSQPQGDGPDTPFQHPGSQGPPGLPTPQSGDRAPPPRGGALSHRPGLQRERDFRKAGLSGALDTEAAQPQDCPTPPPCFHLGRELQPLAPAPGGIHLFSCSSGGVQAQRLHDPSQPTG